MDVTDDLTKLLQPLPQLAGLGDAQVDTLLVMKLYLKPQLVLSKPCTQREHYNEACDNLALKKESSITDCSNRIYYTLLYGSVFMLYLIE